MGGGEALPLWSMAAVDDDHPPIAFAVQDPGNVGRKLKDPKLGIQGINDRRELDRRLHLAAKQLFG